MDVRLLREEDVRRVIGPTQALEEVRAAFASLARGEATLPNVLFLDMPDREGEVHAKGAFIHGAPFFSIKVASGFYGNPRRGLPISTGCVMVFDGHTGFPAAILFDNGFLTELRTGAAGALAADLLARKQVQQVAILGCGGQARYQLEALVGVRTPSLVNVYCRNRVHAVAYAEEMAKKLGIRVEAVSSPEEAVVGSDLLITTTPSREPIVRQEWVSPGLHITAMGSDLPEKQELDPEVLVRADKVVADSLQQCRNQGEIHHAIESGVMKLEGVYAELGDIVIGKKSGRSSDDEVTVADLTGLGVLDAAVANHVAAAAMRDNLGRVIDV
jgi:ectoine utilization protein EutC